MSKMEDFSTLQELSNKKALRKLLLPLNNYPNYYASHVFDT